MNQKSESETAPPERWKHGQGKETARDGRQRVRDGVARFQREGRISGADVVACNRFYSDFALGNEGVADSDHPGRGSGDIHGFQFARVRANQQWRAACDAVGQFGSGILVAFVIKHLTIEAIAESINLPRAETKGAIIATLRRLTEFYAPRPASLRAIHAS